MTGDSRATARLTVFLVALAMVAVPMPALASHNSAGVGVELVQPDEIPDGDQMSPDVPDTSPLKPQFHDNLVTPRPAPSDQTGERYSDCNGPDDTSTYDPGSDASDCYIGFFDVQLEYIVLTSVLVTRGAGDPLYPVNPDPGDQDCTGQDQSSPEEQLVDRANHTVNGLQGEGDCTGGDHLWYAPPFRTLAIDTDLMDAPFQGDQNAPGLTDATGSEYGSGTLTFPFTASTYMYIFGQPHPDNTNPSDLEAGQGMFGPNPAAGGGPVNDLTDACDGRTAECKLLTPTDIKLYDDLSRAERTNAQARVCTFLPQYFSLTPGTLNNQPCGPFGGQTNQFYPSTSQGGLGIDGAPGTWHHTMPGWHGFSWLLNHQSTTEFADFNCDGGSLCHDYLEDGEQLEPGNMMFFAVNPKVPDVNGPLWCVKPNFIGQSSTIGDTGLSDNGFYDYEADAIDSDVYTHWIHPATTVLVEHTEGPVRDVVGPVQDASPISRFDLTSAQAVAEAQSLQGDEETERTLAEQGAPAEVMDAYDRFDFTEAAHDEPHAELGSQNQRSFERTVDTGLRCDPTGVVRLFETTQTDQGGLQFDADVSSTNTPDLKDATLFGDDGLPARESETHDGAWTPEEYSFSGSSLAKLDTSQDTDASSPGNDGDGDGKAFDPCAQALGQPQPTRDFCPWQGVWDAYNENCNVPDGTDSPPTCGTVLKDRGYAVDSDTGVGLYFVLEVTGPTVVYDEDLFDAGRVIDVLGENDAAATNCVVGTSIGFDAKLPNVLGVATVDAAVTQLCSDAGGETLFIDDAFDDQGGLGGGFSSDIAWTKLTPTAQGVQDNTGGLGEADSLTLNGVWTIQDGKTAEDSGSFALGSDANLYEFSDVDSLDT